MRAVGLVSALGLLGVTTGCRSTTIVAPNYPDTSAYDQDPQFAGEWLGDISGRWGGLTMGELGNDRFFGSFVADDEQVEYALLLEQSFVDLPDGGRVPGNRMLFTWQDGLGGRGKGWLLINREDTALTGSFGYGEATEGLGSWTMLRVD